RTASGPTASLHHGCSTNEGQQGSRRVTKGQSQSTPEQVFLEYSQVSGLGRADLIMLRSVVRFHLALPASDTISQQRATTGSQFKSLSKARTLAAESRWRAKSARCLASLAEVRRMRSFTSGMARGVMLSSWTPRPMRSPAACGSDATSPHT